MKHYILSILLTFSFMNAQAFDWPWKSKSEEVFKTINKTLSSRGNSEHKVVVYKVRDISKRVLNKQYTAKDDSMSAEAISYLKNKLEGMRVEAQIYTNIYLGFDNSEFNKDDIKVDGDKLTVKLPEIKIVSTDIDFNDSILITKESGIMTSSKERDELITSLFNNHKKKVLDNLLKDEVSMSRAEENAKTILKDIVMQQYGTDYTVFFEN